MTRLAALALAAVLTACTTPPPAPAAADPGTLLGYTPGGSHTRRIGP